MNERNSPEPRRRARIGVAVVAAAVYAASLPFATGADTNTEKTQPAKKAMKQKLTGAELYSIHCNRCHAERYATERTDAQWKTIMMHMQTRAQLPGKDAKAILKYLQENN